MKSNQDSIWISLSDLMTALMMIFMFIAINYMIQFVEYQFIEKNIYNKYEDILEKEIESGLIQLGPNGEVSFTDMRQSNELFTVNKSEPTEFFKERLSEFLPQYWKIISDSNYIDYIEEIRIEGHADSKPFTGSTKEESYLRNLKLSQERARNILKFMRTLPFYLDADSSEKNQMDFKFAAIGFSSSRVINKAGEYVYDSSTFDKNIDDDLSRRVVFRLRTSNPELVEKIYTEKSK